MNVEIGALGWHCPHCGTKQAISSSNFFDIEIPPNRKYIGSPDGAYFENRIFVMKSVSCISPDCRKETIYLQIGSFDSFSMANGRMKTNFNLDVDVGRIYPKNFEAIDSLDIPEYIYKNYYEAKAIIDLSPNAAAALLRRCLQGAIRDFCKIERKTLFEEISTLEAKALEGTAPIGVSIESINDLTAIREFGNAASHLGGDADRIIDVEIEEAKALCVVMENILSSWYKERAARQRASERVNSLLKKKLK